MTHTPGPWRISNNTARGACRECPTTVIAGESGAQVTGLSDGWDAPTRDANARLIASAPELLAALEEYCNYYTPDKETQLGNGQARRSLERFRAAIAKAVEGA